MGAMKDPGPASCVLGPWQSAQFWLTNAAMTAAFVLRSVALFSSALAIEVTTARQDANSRDVQTHAKAGGFMAPLVYQPLGHFPCDISSFLVRVSVGSTHGRNTRLNLGYGHNSRYILRLKARQFAPSCVQQQSMFANLTSKLIGLLFGAAFGTAGLGLCGYTVYTAIEWYETASWIEVPGKFDSLKLREIHNEGTTYRVECTYHYSVNGQQYSGDRPCLILGSDNIGSFQKNLHTRLLAAKKNDTLKVLVDPDDPTRSLLDRNFRCGFFSFMQAFGSVFATVGIAIFLTTWFARQPSERNGWLRVDSGHRTTRIACGVLLVFLCDSIFGIGTHCCTELDGRRLDGVVRDVGCLSLRNCDLLFGQGEKEAGR